MNIPKQKLFTTLLMILFMGGILNATAQENINNDKITKEDTTVSVLEYPEFPGGEDSLLMFLYENIVYPEKARIKGKEGRVMVGFIVEPDGRLTNFTILESVHPLLDNEALRVVKMMPKWKPGKKDGKFVRVQFQLPVRFVLTD